MAPAEGLENAVLVRLVLVAVGEDLLDEVVEVGVGAEGALRGQLLPARRALLVPGAQRRHDAFGAKPEKDGFSVSISSSLLGFHMMIRGRLVDLNFRCCSTTEGLGGRLFSDWVGLT